MRLIDLDLTIFVPIIDESKGGVKYEMQMTVGELFQKFFDGNVPEVVDAIPLEWLEQKRKCSDPESVRDINGVFVTICIDGVLVLWQKEQGAR